MQDNELLIFLREKTECQQRRKLQAGRASAPTNVCLAQDKQN